MGTFTQAYEQVACIYKILQPLHRMQCKIGGAAPTEAQSTGPFLKVTTCWAAMRA